MKILELKGLKSLRALNAFSSLLLGVKMLPVYSTLSYEDFLNAVQLMPEDDQRNVLKKAAEFVELAKDEIEALASFACDPNGVPYQSSNLKSLGPDELVKIIVEVCLEIAKIKIDLVSESEKKKSLTSA